METAIKSSPVKVTINSKGVKTGVDKTLVNIYVPEWEKIENKPFNSVDEETLDTRGGVLRFKTASYESLTNLPLIGGIELKGNKNFEDLGLQECSILDIEKLFI